MPHSERHEELVAAARRSAAPLGADAAGARAPPGRGLPDAARSSFAEGREAAAALATAVPPAAPPPELRERILASLGRRAARPARPPGPWRVLAAAAALLLVAVGLDDARLRREREDLRSQSGRPRGRLQTAETALAERTLRARVLESDDVADDAARRHGTAAGARARGCSGARRPGAACSSPRSLAALPSGPPVRALGLPERQAGQRRRLRRGRVGPRALRVDGFPEPAAQNFAVTVEPRGGVPAPTGPVVLVGRARVERRSSASFRAPPRSCSRRRRRPSAEPRLRLRFRRSASPSTSPASASGRASARRRVETRAPHRSDLLRADAVLVGGRARRPHRYALEELARTARLLRQSGRDAPARPSARHGDRARRSGRSRRRRVRRPEAVAAPRPAARRARPGAPRLPDALARRGRGRLLRRAARGAATPTGGSSTARCSS